MATPASATTGNARLSPALVEATLKLALAQHQRGALPLAAALYDQVLTIDPANADALHLKGMLMLAQSQALEALALIERACAHLPASALFHRSRAEALNALGRWPEACAALKAAIKLKPDWAEAHAVLGMGYAVHGDNQAAKSSLTQAVRLDRKLAEAWNNLGVLHLADTEINAAITAFSSALAARPDFVEARNGLGIALTEQGHPTDAIEAFDRALEKLPNDASNRADIFANRAVALQKLERWPEALSDLQTALVQRPERGPLWRNLAKPLIVLGRLDEAEAACTRALAIDADDHASRYERSFVRLSAGNIAGGFDDYRWRPTVDRQRFPMPEQPLPADLTGRRLRLVLEQGLGEHLFFLRYAPILTARGAEIVCEIDAKLSAIIGNHSALGRCVARNEPTSGYEPILIGDLPFLTGATDTPPSRSLTPDPALQADIKKQLSALGPAPYVALTWRAGIQDGKSLSKIVPIDALAQTLTGNATLISIQRQPAAGETEALARLIGRPVHDLSPLNDDLAAMLALLSLTDDYIGVSNTNMHLRAGLGLPARVLVPHPSEFRWLATGDRSPWFPDFTLYRADLGGWQRAMTKLSADLAR